MAEADPVIHQPLRLKLMATLNPLPQGEALEFTRLKQILATTDGNLGAHLATLEKAGYVDILKDFVGKKPRTRVAMTRAGRKAFAAHVDYLREVLGGAA